MATYHGKLNKDRIKRGMSGLQGAKRLRARALAKRSAMNAVKKKDQLHYTQSLKRWEGIDREVRGIHGDVPGHADCSAFVTWILWDVLNKHYGLKRDIVNGQLWKMGYTGTIVRHGEKIGPVRRWRVGDLVLYGDPWGPTGHVAIYVGLGMVVSFGSEPGPFYLKWDYRSDHYGTYRFI